MEGVAVPGVDGRGLLPPTQPAAPTPAELLVQVGSQQRGGGVVSEAHGLAAEEALIRTTAGVMTEGTRTLEVDGGELPPPPPPATTPPAQMTQVESQQHADAMAAEALRLATEAAQLNAAAVKK